MADVSDFVEALVRVASGGTALDPEVVTQLMGASRRSDSISVLSARERDVLALMAEGRSNAAIAVTLVLWLPDLWILSKGQPAKAVAVLMAMHLAIAVVTYNSLVHLAPPHRRHGVASGG